NTPILAIKLPRFVTDGALLWVHKDLEAPLHSLIIHFESLGNVKNFSRSIRKLRIIAQWPRQHLYKKPIQEKD
ncbi:unnamed protein product, partial [Dovyalis caffra]